MLLYEFCWLSEFQCSWWHCFDSNKYTEFHLSSTTKSDAWFFSNSDFRLWLQCCKFIYFVACLIGIIFFKVRMTVLGVIVSQPTYCSNLSCIPDLIGYNMWPGSINFYPFVLLSFILIYSFSIYTWVDVVWGARKLTPSRNPTSAYVDPIKFEVC